MDLWDFDGKKVKIICDNGRVFQGVACVEDDETTGKTCIDIRDGRLYEIYQDEIVEIKEIVNSEEIINIEEYEMLELALSKAIDFAVNVHAKDIMERKESDFHEGALFGISSVLDSIKDYLEIFAPIFIKNVGLDFDVEREIQ